MVTQVGHARPLALAAILLLGAVPAVHADGLLEQMQNEIAAIVRTNKGGIVAIEDEGAPHPHRADANSDARRLAGQQALVNHLAMLQSQQDGVAGQLTAALTIYKPTHPKVLSLQNERETLQEEIRKLSVELTKEPDAVQLRQLLQGIRLTQWTQKRDALQVDLQKSLLIYKPEHAHVQGLRQELQTADSTVLELTKALQGRRGPTALERANAPKSGSGFSIGNGYVVTTADVVEGMQRPLVIADDGTRMRAKIVGIDSEMNLGVLQLPAKANLFALKMGDSDTVVAGHFAVSIGNQAGHANSVALAMIAGIRTDGTYTGDHFYPALLQITGTIGAGTSGAPLLNARGEVIGVIAGVPAGEWTETQVYTEQSFSPPPLGNGKKFPPDAPPHRTPQPEPRSERFGQGPGKTGFVFGQALPSEDQNGPPPMRVFLRPPVTGTGFAIPINDLRFSIKELIANGKIVHTWVGVDLKPDRKVNDADGIIKVMRYVRIRGIYPDSPAQKAGLQPGDILVELNAKPVTSLSGVRATFMRLHPADKLAVMVERNGMTQTMTLNVVARPDRIIPPAELPNAHPK